MSEKYKVIIADDDNLVCTALEMTDMKPSGSMGSTSRI